MTEENQNQNVIKNVQFAKRDAKYNAILNQRDLFTVKLKADKSLVISNLPINDQ